ncbi:MAG: NADH-quinone oxidoreductase subunit M [Thermodesulfobacteriota bacterium]
MHAYPVLSYLIFFPLLACLALALVRDDRTVRVFTLAAGLAELALALPLLAFDTAYGGFQFVERADWVKEWGLSYHLGVDGISLLMVLLTLLLLPLCTLCSWTYIRKRVKEFHVCLLLMTSACAGVFCALDLALFYVFWEAMLVPMYLLIAVWGGPQRRYASIKFFLYTLAGSTLLLVAMVALYWQAGTFSIPELMGRDYPRDFQLWVFLAMGLAFAIKVPMFPFHTWLPAAHVEAPSAGSVYLASILLKMGAYGFLRFSIPVTPLAAEHFTPLMIAVSVASILYGGLAALGQQDMKKLIAYSSVGHMGFCTLGIFLFNLRGAEGALMIMLNHGITTGALFMMVGAVYERSHSREIADNLGLGKRLPAFMGFFGLFALSSFGFPGTNSFVGEVLVFFGAFERSTAYGLWAAPGAMIAAAYMLRLSLKLAWGEPPSPKSGRGRWYDLNLREWAYLAPLGALVLYVGLAPGIFLKVVDPSLDKLLSDYAGRVRTAAAQPESPEAPDVLAALPGAERRN